MRRAKIWLTLLAIQRFQTFCVYLNEYVKVDGHVNILFIYFQT